MRPKEMKALEGRTRIMLGPAPDPDVFGARRRWESDLVWERSHADVCV